MQNEVEQTGGETQSGKSRLEERLTRLNRTYAFMSAINQAVVRVKGEQELFERACAIAVERGHFRMAWVGLRDPRTNRVIPVASAGVAQDYLDRLNIALDDSPEGRGPTAVALKAGQHIVVNDIAGESFMAPWREYALRLGFRASAAFPLFLDSQVYGCINLYASSAGFFDEEEMRLLDELAEDLSFALEHLAQERQRREAVDAMHRSQDRYRKLVENFPKGLILTFNRELRMTSGGGSDPFQMNFSIENILGRRLDEINSPEIIAMAKPYLLDAFKGRPGSFEMRTPVGDSYICNVTPLYANNGEIDEILVSAIDITEQKLAQIALYEREARLKTTLQVARMGGWEADPVTLKRVWSDEMFTLTGFDPSRGTPSFEQFLEFVHPEDRKRVSKVYRRLSQTGRPDDHEFRSSPDRGPVHHFLAHIEALFQPDGQQDKYIGTLQDITERKKIEEALRASEARFRAVFDHSRDAKGVAKRGITEYVNPAYVKMFGYDSQEELIGTPLINLFAPECRESVIENIRKRASGEAAPTAYETIGLRKDGTRFDMDVLVSTFEIDGETYSLGILRDITERKRLDRELREQKEILQKIFDNIPLMIDVIGEDGKFFLVNREWERTLGWTLEEIQRDGVDVFSEMYPDSKDWQRAVENLLASPKKWVDFRTRVRDGWVIDTTWMDVRLSDGKVIGIGQDITERKQLEMALLEERSMLAQRVEERTSALYQMNVELERASRTKDEFLANMSHELRTPLNGILMLAESLQELIYGPLNERQTRAVQGMETNGRHLLDLINDILDLSKVSSGKLEITPEMLSVREVCLASLAFVKQPAQKKNIHLNLEMADDGFRLRADPRRLKQILVNLLSNAVKFTGEGGEVSLRVEPDPRRQYLLFEVCDNGIGISAEDQARLFRPFTQIDSGLNRMNEGTGLGLALTKRLVEMHQGKITVESEPGKGSCFTAALPWQPQDALVQASDAECQSAGLAGYRPETSAGMILMAEDHETNATVVVDLLEHMGFQVVLAKNGREAIALARQIRPDIILMDVQMPEMDGLGAIRELRMDARFTATPIVALTALAMKGDRERCLEAGANDYISKPIHLKDLKQVIERYLLKKAGETGPDSTTRP